MSRRRRGQEPKREEAGKRRSRGWSSPDGSLRLSAESSLSALEKGRAPRRRAEGDARAPPAR